MVNDKRGLVGWVLVTEWNQFFQSSKGRELFVDDVEPFWSLFVADVERFGASLLLTWSIFGASQ